MNASPLPSPHIKKYGSSTSVPRDPYEFETLFLWLKDLRLHKYISIFSNLSFDEVSVVTMAIYLVTVSTKLDV